MVFGGGVGLVVVWFACASVGVAASGAGALPLVDGVGAPSGDGVLALSDDDVGVWEAALFAVGARGVGCDVDVCGEVDDAQVVGGHGVLSGLWAGPQPPPG